MPSSPNYHSFDCDTSSSIIIALSEKHGWKDVGIVVIPGHVFIHAQGVNIDIGNIYDNEVYKQNFKLSVNWEPSPLLNEQIASSAYENLGNTKCKLGEFAGAIADYSKALELNPNYEGVYFARGFAKIEIGDFAGAIADYSKLLEQGFSQGI